MKAHGEKAHNRFKRLGTQRSSAGSATAAGEVAIPGKESQDSRPDMAAVRTSVGDGVCVGPKLQTMTPTKKRQLNTWAQPKGSSCEWRPGADSKRQTVSRAGKATWLFQDHRS